VANPTRLVTPEKREDDLEASIRPLALSDFTGQRAARANLQVFIDAAKTRGDALDHVLFVGPPGLGKTTLAQIVARELGVNFRSTSGPVIAKAGDLAAQLTNLEERDVLFIDEIHRLNPAVEEILYPAMEDFRLDITIDTGPAAHLSGLDLQAYIGQLEKRMREAAANLEFEEAARLRDEIKRLEDGELGLPTSRLALPSSRAKSAAWKPEGGTRADKRKAAQAKSRSRRKAGA